jgi:hypothetical protein
MTPAEWFGVVAYILLSAVTFGGKKGESSGYTEEDWR